MEDQDGELVLPVPGERFGDALFSFIQAVLKINDVSYLSRERVRSTFREDFREFLAEIIPEDRLTLDWRHAEHDPKGIYAADCRVEHPTRPRTSRRSDATCSPASQTCATASYSSFEGNRHRIVRFLEAAAA